MKTYIGTKTIQATEMSAIDAFNKGYRTDDFESTDYPGYEVTYDNGYKSWSPKEAFEKTYKEVE